MSRLDPELILQLLGEKSLTELFRELGWEIPVHPVKQNIDVESGQVTAIEVANKYAIRVWLVDAKVNGLNRKDIRLVDKAIRINCVDRLIIVDRGNSREWLWPVATNSQGVGITRLVAHMHRDGQRPEALIQRIGDIRIAPDERALDVVAVRGRIAKAFDAEKLTASFYKKFQTEHEGLLKKIKGISDKTSRSWYASLLMNRLMFIYFIQRKGFLDNDPNYLINRLIKVRMRNKTSGGAAGTFFDFYRDFLCPLFHEGLGSKGRPIRRGAIQEIIGDVPYINGGIFAVHPLEEEYNIEIPDSAFEKVFTFFDSYQWHLDDRPTGNPMEINPDVLGHIFEQFINQKEQGAYYTKEDVTSYMTSSTLLPVFLDRLESELGVNPWFRLKDDPNRYIWPSVRHGIFDQENNLQQFPAKIRAEGKTWPRPTWGEQADGRYGLPGETWWEVDYRRNQYTELLDRINSGKISTSDEAVTSNLDLLTIAVDAIDEIDSPKDAVKAWDILERLRVIDPTCGSGAFLFAALKILEDLYAAVLDSLKKHGPTSKDKRLTALIARVASHSSDEYFISKNAILRNLYGVDLMSEAIEIARLRLFLRLASHVRTRDQLEPLPDLDFNLKAGNALVGALNTDSVDAEQGDLFSESAATEAKDAASEAALLYREFQNAIENADEERIRILKADLQNKFLKLRKKVDKIYFKGLTAGLQTIDEWRQQSWPFHWFLEFPEVMSRGGFDVVVGNPPYIRRSKIEYEFSGFKTDCLGDIYAACVERALMITRKNGRMVMIVPISSQFGDDYRILRQVLEDRSSHLWAIAFDRRPATIFGSKVGVRNTIWMCKIDESEYCSRFVTTTHRWVNDFRPHLFSLVRFTPLSNSQPPLFWCRLSSLEVRLIFEIMMQENRNCIEGATSSDPRFRVGVKGNALYYLSCFLKPPPVVEADGRRSIPTMMLWLSFKNRKMQMAALAVMLSKLCFVWWFLTSDNLNVTAKGMKSVPVDLVKLEQTHPDEFLELVRLGEVLWKSLARDIKWTQYLNRKVARYEVPNVRQVTDQVDLVLAKVFRWEPLLAGLELAYAQAFKGTDDESDD